MIYFCSSQIIVRKYEIAVKIKLMNPGRQKYYSKVYSIFIGN